jgi:hypothetical protein
MFRDDGARAAWASRVDHRGAEGRPDRWAAGSAPEKLWAPTTTDVPVVLVWLSSSSRLTPMRERD